ncbi:MAG TPA: response regulator transcription factor [Coleofasciculaceae cyanobacterium]
MIVDDQKTVQEILISYIKSAQGLELIGCANNGQEAISLIKIHQPDIVLMDIEMPILDGLAATQIIFEQFINTSVLIISVHNENIYLNTALQVGAKGYLKKNTPEKELINAIYCAHKGYFQLGPGLLEQYLHKATKSQSNFEEIEQLKSVILQQSKLLDNLNNGFSDQFKTGRSSARNARATSQNFIENQYSILKKQVYYVSNRIDKLNQRIGFLQQLCGLAILCSASLGIVFLFSIL